MKRPDYARRGVSLSRARVASRKASPPTLRRCDAFRALETAQEPGNPVAAVNAAQMNHLRLEKGLIHTSGKMVLLDKLLPKLKSEGHKVRRRFCSPGTDAPPPRVGWVRSFRAGIPDD